jgi:hypothetical protein
VKSLSRKIIAAVAVLAIGAVAGPWVYINLIKDDAPEALTLEPSTTTIAPESSTTIAVESTTTIAPASTIDGEWKVVAESIVGYRVKETIVGQKTEGVGRTSEIIGSLTIVDKQVTATFTLKEPITLTPEALAGSDFSVDTTGTLTLRGVTKDIDLTLIARLVDDVIEVNGSIQIVFTDWSIPDPSISSIIVVDRGLLEFLVRFKR